MSKKLMFVVNVDWFFMSHRLPIALEAQRQGYEVHIATELTNRKEAMEQFGLIVHPILLDRSSANLIDAIRTFWQIVAVFRKVKPDLVHLITIKPVLLGGIAARLIGVSGVVAAVPGLGYVFLDRGWVSRIRRKVVASLYRLALGHRNLKVIFQNPDDRDSLIDLTGLSMNKVEMIRGSGVDLNEFRYTPLPEGTPVVLMAARLIADKGVREFAEAARLLRKKGNDVRCCIVGSPDPANPSGLSEAELSAWEAEGIVERWGHRNDMANVLSAAHIVVLPSYREGLPKVLLEAAAVGRAVVTTDVPGCRDAIDPEVTGILVPSRDAQALAIAIEGLLKNSQRCTAMGVAGRTLAEREFDIQQVIAKHMYLYQQLMTAGK
ncbi:MAG: glycosyltransferase family 4 protein [Nitrosomonadales bacterium]|nr:glycosyltransferase family 4 protein [Nitrosomonadales bacterium]